MLHVPDVPGDSLWGLWQGNPRAHLLLSRSCLKQKWNPADIQLMKQAINNAISKQVGQVSTKTSIIHFNLKIKNRSKKKKKSQSRLILLPSHPLKYQAPRETECYQGYVLFLMDFTLNSSLAYYMATFYCTKLVLK